MKIKLTYQQFNCLYSIVEAVITDDAEYSMMQKLLLSVLVGVYKKMYVRAIERKTAYCLKLSDSEAIAFWMLFNRNTYAVDSFEGNLLQTINNQIHKKYA